MRTVSERAEESSRHVEGARGVGRGGHFPPTVELPSPRCWDLSLRQSKTSLEGQLQSSPFSYRWGRCMWSGEPGKGICKLLLPYKRLFLRM